MLNPAGVSLVQDSNVHQRPLTRQQTEHDVTPLHSTLDVGQRLAKGSVTDLERLTKGAAAYSRNNGKQAQGLLSRDGLSAKRKRVDSFSDPQQPRDLFPSTQPYAKAQSRGLMPPPPVPDRNPHVFMGLRFPDPDVDNNDRNDEAGRGDEGRGRAIPHTPQREPSQDDLYRSARGDPRSTNGQPRRPLGNNAQASQSPYTPSSEDLHSRHGTVNRGRPVLYTQNQTTRYLRPTGSHQGDPVSIGIIPDPRNATAPHGPGMSRNIRTSSSQERVSPYDPSPLRRRSIAAHWQLPAASPHFGSQRARNGRFPDENLRSRARTLAQLLTHHRTPSNLTLDPVTESGDLTPPSGRRSARR